MLLCSLVLCKKESHLCSVVVAVGDHTKIKMDFTYFLVILAAISPALATTPLVMWHGMGKKTTGSLSVGK